MKLNLGNFIFRFSSSELPFVSFIIISIIFSPILSSLLTKLIRYSIPNDYPSDDIINYTFDGYSRLSSFMTLLGAIPYFSWELLEKQFPNIITFLCFVVLIIVFIAGCLFLTLFTPPKLHIEAFWCGWRTGTWTAIAATLLNLLLLCLSAMQPLPIPSIIT